MKNMAQFICLIVIFALMAISCQAHESNEHVVNKRQDCYNGPVFPNCCFSNCCRDAPVLGEWGPFCCRASGRGSCSV